jgi:hypothetical protein
MQRINDLLSQLASQDPGVHIVDLAAWVSDQPGGVADTNLRPDGVHFSSTSATQTVAPWLGPAILEALGPDPTQHSPPPTAPR